MLAGSLGSSRYHAGIKSIWLCFITNQGSNYLVIILPPSSPIAWVNTTSACILRVWPSTFATRGENSGVLGCAAPPSALPGVIPVALGWCKKGMSWAGCAKSSDGAQCQLMDELSLTQLSRDHFSQPKSHVGRRWVLQGSSCAPWTVLSVTSGHRLLLWASSRREGPNKRLKGPWKGVRVRFALWCWGVNVSSSARWHWVRWAQISGTPVLKSFGYLWTCYGFEKQLARTPWASGPSLKSLLASSPECCQQVGIAPSIDPSASGWGLPFQAALRLRLKGRRRHV